jgi:hypothetical protein
MATMLEDWPRRRLAETTRWDAATSALEAEVLEELEWLDEEAWAWEAGASLPMTASRGRMTIGSPSVEISWPDWYPAAGVSWRELLQKGIPWPELLRNSVFRSRKTEMERRYIPFLYRIFLIIPNPQLARGFFQSLTSTYKPPDTPGAVKSLTGKKVQKLIIKPAHITAGKDLRPLYIGETRDHPLDRLKQHLQKQYLEEGFEAGDPEVIAVSSAIKQHPALGKGADMIKVQLKIIEPASGRPIRRPARVAAEQLHIWREQPLLQEIWQQR